MCNKKKYKEAFAILNELKQYGYSNSDISLSMIDTLKTIPKTIISEHTKIKYIMEVGKATLNISRGIDTFLQLTGCISKLCML